MDSDQEISNAPIDSLANSIRDILNQETGKKVIIFLKCLKHLIYRENMLIRSLFWLAEKLL